MAEGDGSTDTGTGTAEGTSTEGNGATPPEGTGQQQDGTEGKAGQQDGQQGTEGQGQQDGTGELPEHVQQLIANARKVEREAKAEARREREAREALERERMSDQERAIADAKREGLTEGNRRLARAAVRELAVEANYADATDAVAFLGDKLTNYVDDDGEVDEEAVKADLSDLARRKPHLLRQERRAPKGGADHSGGQGESDPVEEFNALLRNS